MMIRGAFTGLSYQSPDRTYSVFWFRMRMRTVKAIWHGYNAPCTGNDEYMIRGRWANSEKYGPQFYFDHFQVADTYIRNGKRNIEKILNCLEHRA